MEAKNLPGAPKAIGPYCHAMKVGDLVFCSGQTPLNPDTMEIVGEDICTQTERVLQNLGLVLAGLGMDLNNVAKTTVYLKDMADFQGMNEVYARMFGDHSSFAYHHRGQTEPVGRAGRDRMCSNLGVSNHCLHGGRS